MTLEERSQIVVTARLLRAAAPMQWLAIGLTIVAAARGGIAALAPIALGLVAIVYGIRVSFDARLFEDVAADRLSEIELDSGLATLRKGKSNRAWDDRCRGARRLAVILAAITLAQLIAVVLTGLS